MRSLILYKVLENGIWVTKYNTLNILQINNEDVNQNSIQGNLKGVNDNEIILTYTEPTTSCQRRKTATLELKFFEENGEEKLQWDRKISRNNYIGNGVYPDGSLWDESNFIIPKNLILTKVN